MKKVVIAYLYPEQMNIYGDRGNVMVLAQRLKWRGYKSEIINIKPKTNFDFKKADIVFGGGGQDHGQSLIAEDLLSRKDDILSAADSGVAMLVICGSYQLFGKSFITIEDESLPGIGLFSAHTIGSKVRMIGNIVVDSPWGQLVGFENHSGQTTLGDGQEPIGKVLKGFGNNETSKHEGAVTHNVFGTYLHGPILSKNPNLADEIILRALKRKHKIRKLAPLNDTLEIEAAEIAKTRPE